MMAYLWQGGEGRELCVVYFDQLSGATSTRKLIKLLFVKSSLNLCLNNYYCLSFLTLTITTLFLIFSTVHCSILAPAYWDQTYTILLAPAKNVKKDFDKQTKRCAAPVSWSKYTTCTLRLELENMVVKWKYDPNSFPYSMGFHGAPTGDLQRL